MQLRKARLCIDCEELHDQWQCPVCASETFAFITRWMPAPERRKKPRPAGAAWFAPRADDDSDSGGVAGVVRSTLLRLRDVAREHLKAA
jgi:hypothetical protein